MPSRPSRDAGSRAFSAESVRRGSHAASPSRPLIVQCWIDTLLWFCGVPLLVAMGVHAIAGVANRVTPPFRDRAPSTLRVALAAAAFVTVAWGLQCHFGLHLLPDGGCVCGLVCAGNH